MHYAASIRDKADADGEETIAFRPPIGFHANVQPVRGQTAGAMYGERLPYVKRLYGATATLSPGMGVWVDAPLNREPDYEVLTDQSYPQERVYDIGRRGIAGG